MVAFIILDETTGSSTTKASSFRSFVLNDRMLFHQNGCWSEQKWFKKEVFVPNVNLNVSNAVRSYWMRFSFDYECIRLVLKVFRIVTMTHQDDMQMDQNQDKMNGATDQTKNVMEIIRKWKVRSQTGKVSFSRMKRVGIRTYLITNFYFTFFAHI